MTMITDRPAEVDDRVQVGHWEGDCIMGVGNRSAIGTLVERSTRYLILIHIPTGRPTAEAMRTGITTARPGIKARNWRCISESPPRPFMFSLLPRGRRV
jgi:IS30 family transposase